MPQNMKLIETPIQGLYLVQRNIVVDSRGSFFRVYCHNELSKRGFDTPLNQINFNVAHDRHTTKGIHYQLPPFAEDKMITCTRGEIFDVAVDLRKDSPTFLKHFAANLTDQNRLSLLIPRGFGHGWQSLTDDASVLYLHTSSYAPEYERGINIFDPALDIAWPNEPKHLSDRDQNFESLNVDFPGVEI